MKNYHSTYDLGDEQDLYLYLIYILSINAYLKFLPHFVKLNMVILEYYSFVLNLINYLNYSLI